MGRRCFSKAEAELLSSYLPGFEKALVNKDTTIYVANIVPAYKDKFPVAPPADGDNDDGSSEDLNFEHDKPEIFAQAQAGGFWKDTVFVVGCIYDHLQPRLM
jgi:hypothetical protein